MSKKKIALILLVAIVVFGVAAYFSFRDDSKPKEGIYKVENCAAYPDAYIEIKEGRAQFFNIDLNTLYKDEIVERYIQYLTNMKEQQITEDDRREIEASIDLNKMFCNESVVLDYSKINMRDDEKHYLYYYTFGFITEVDNMSYSYNTRENCIMIGRDETNSIVFRKQ